MGPQGLMVIEDCDRTVILAPAAMDLPAPEPSSWEESEVLKDAGPPESSLDTQKLENVEDVKREFEESLGEASSPFSSSRGAARAAAKPSRPSSISSSLSRSSSRDELTAVAGRTPPKPPEFLKEMTPPKT